MNAGIYGIEESSGDARRSLGQQIAAKTYKGFSGHAVRSVLR